MLSRVLLSEFLVREELGLNTSLASFDPTAAMSLPPKPFRLRWAVIVGLSFLCASVTSTVALGECGDYVIVGGKARGGSLEWQSRFMRQNSQQSMPMQHSGPQPCHGPSCHSRDPLPSSPVAASSLASSQWAYLGLLAEVPGPASARLLIWEAKPRTQIYSDPIYHPPRNV
jgi:hypothetical protein